MLANFFVHCVGGMAISDAGYRFTLGDSGALAVGVIRRLTPGIETVKTLLGFSICTRILPVHINAISAAVNLRRAHLNKVEKRKFESGLVNISFQSLHGFVNAGSNFHSVDSRLQL